MSKTYEHIIIYTDGGSRGNPGPAAAAFVLNDDRGQPFFSRALYIGKATNNVAEYTAIVEALKAVGQFEPKNLTIVSDSELIVKQIQGLYKVKSENMKPFYQKTMELLDKFEKWKIRHVKRHKNKQADELVNKALDQKRDIEMNSHTPENKTKPIRLGVLISGSGRTMMNILNHIKSKTLNAEIALVISSRSTVSGIEKAKSAKLPVKIIRTKDHPDIDNFSNTLEQALTEANVDLVIQGGWLCLWKIPKTFENKVMNIHPALLPSFGGKGMWGHHVHEAVLSTGCKVSGCTVHFCNNKYDAGPIIIQRCCPVAEDDTPDTLASRVFEQECIAYPQAIRLFIEKRLKVTNNKVSISRP